ncbi:MAG: hypothetical protein ACKO96_09240 [Flammeovirgaceae bacterium]
MEAAAHFILTIKYWIVARKVEEISTNIVDKSFGCKLWSIVIVWAVFLFTSTVLFGLDIYYGYNTAVMINYWCSITVWVPSWIIVVVMVDAFVRLNKQNTHTISKKVMALQLAANIVYASADSVYAYMYFREFFWIWYIRVFFEITSLIVLTFTLIDIAKIQLANQSSDNLNGSLYSLS